MEFLDNMLTVFTFLGALLGLAIVILGVYILFKAPIKYQPPPLVEPIAACLMGGVAIIGGLEILFGNAYLLFTGKLMGTHHLAGASAFLLFFMVMGTATILGRPFLAAKLIPKLPSKRLLLGASFIIYGFLCFFKLSEDF